MSALPCLSCALRWLGMSLIAVVLIWAAWCAFLFVASLFMSWGPHE